MTQAHINSILPIKNRVLAVDENTTFLAHYDLNEHDVLRNIKAAGSTKSPLWDVAYFKASGSHYISTKTLTMSAWVYPTAVPNNDRGALIIGKGVGGGYYLTIDNTYHLGAYWHGKSPAGYHTSTGTCPLNQWTHVALVWSETELKMYINGSLDKTISVTGTGVSVDALDIGSETTLGNRGFRGKIRDLGIWSDAKSDAGIISIMNEGIQNNETRLRAFWKMDEGEGNILRDSSPFHTDITPYAGNFTWSTGNSVFTLRPKEGYFGGGAIALEEGTTNLLYDNGIFNGSFATLTLTPTVTSIVPESKWRITTNAGAGSTIRFYVPLAKLANGLTYNLSYKYKIIRGATFSMGDWGDTALTKRDEDFGGYKFSSAYGTRATYDSTFRFMDFNISPDTEIEIWDIQLEQKSFSTSFVNGIRLVSRLQYHLPASLSQFTFSFWAKSNGYSGSYPFYINIYPGGVVDDNNRVYIRPTSNTAIGAGRVVSGSISSIPQSIISDIKDWHMYSLVSDGATMKLFQDGQLSSSSSSITELPSSSMLLELSGNSNNNSVLYDEVRIDKVARTDEEIVAWFQSNSPFWPRGIYRKSY